MNGRETSPLFDIQDLSVGYGNGIYIFRGLTVQVPLGKKVAVVGRSGVGKSTFLHLLGLISEEAVKSGLITYRCPRTGEAVEYTRLADRSAKDRLRLRDFGFVFQTACLFPHLTCRENIALPLVLQGYSKQQWWRKVEKLLTMVEAIDGELIALADRLGPFSGGQRQRIAVLRAIIHDPLVVFADEPLSNLDPRSTEAVLAILRNWHDGHLHDQTIDIPRTLLIATHDLQEAWDFCDTFVVFNCVGRLLQNRAVSKSELEAAGGITAITQWMASSD